MIHTKTRTVESIVATLLCAAGPVWAGPVTINSNESVHAYYPTAMVAQSIARMNMLGGTAYLQGLPVVEITVGEVVSMDDLIDTQPAVVIDVSESVAVSDSNSVDPLPLVHIDIFEEVSLSDIPGLLPSAYISVEETVAVADLPGVVAYPVVHIDIDEVVGVLDDNSASFVKAEVIFLDGFEDH